METPHKGSIKSISLSKILMSLNRERKTGTLSVTTPSFTKKLYVRMGDVIFASSTYTDDRLGEMLLKAGKLSVSQHDRAIGVMKASQRKLGAVLVELGYLSPRDLFWGLKYQVSEIIGSMFLLEEGRYEFVEGDLPKEEVINLKMSMGNLIYAGISRVANWTRIRSEMPDTESVVRLSDDPLSLFQDIELSPQDRKILALVDGKRKIREIIDSSWLGSFDALKVLYVLWSIGMIIEAPTVNQPETGHSQGTAPATYETLSLDAILSPPSEEEDALVKKIEEVEARLGSMTAHELLDVDEFADAEQVRENYYRLAKEFHPDRCFALMDPSIKTKLSSIFDALTKAYSEVRDTLGAGRQVPSSGQGAAGIRESAGDEERIRTAEERGRKGVQEFKRGDFQAAAVHFREATAADPKSVRSWSYLALACAKIPGKLQEAEAAIRSALEIDPFSADLHANLGLVLLKAGQKKRARGSFEKALAIEPSNEKARKGMEQTEE